MRMHVTLEEVASGIEKTIRVKLYQRCETCDGNGSESGERTPCPTCDGQGEVRRAQRSIFGQFVSIEPCPECHGEGQVVSDPCRDCGGEGRVREDRRIPVRIPAGVETGTYLTLREEGNAGPRLASQAAPGLGQRHVPYATTVQHSDLVADEHAGLLGR